MTVEAAELKRDASPGADSAGTLPRGERVTVVEDRGRWLRVKTGGGALGFLPADSVETDAEKLTRERRAGKILSFPPVFGVVAEDTDVLLAPFASAARAGRLSRGTAITIHAVDHAYYAFRRPEGGIAFVNSSDVDLVPPDPRRPAIVPQAGAALKDVVVSDARRELTPVVPENPESMSPESPTARGSEPPGAPRAEAPPDADVVEQAVLVSKVDPDYPPAARSAGVEGLVVLDATVGANGRVTDVTVVRGLPLGITDAAVEAVWRWQYRPARGRSGPVASHKQVRIVFELNQ